MKSCERRLNPRYLLPIPLSFRAYELDSADSEISTRTINNSRSGLFLKSPHRLQVGSKLSLNLRVPTEISGSAFSQLRCRGRVVREEVLSDGTSGYGVELEQLASPPYLPGTSEGTWNSSRV